MDIELEQLDNQVDLVVEVQQLVVLLIHKGEQVMQEVLIHQKVIQEEMEYVGQLHQDKVLGVVEELPLQVEMDLQAVVVMEVLEHQTQLQEQQHLMVEVVEVVPIIQTLVVTLELVVVEFMLLLHERKGFTAYAVACRRLLHVVPTWNAL